MSQRSPSDTEAPAPPVPPAAAARGPLRSKAPGRMDGRARWWLPARSRLGPRLDPRSIQSLGHLGPLVTALRWGCLVVGVALLPTTEDRTSVAMIVGLAALFANTLFRTISPLRLQPATWKAELALLIDLAVSVIVISFTGGWSSPFILTPLPTVILAAYGWGYREGIAAAALTGGTIAMVDLLTGVSQDTLRNGILASGVVLLAALVGGFTRQLWIEAEHRQRETLDQMSRMAIANDLLHALHDIVQTLPASLDLTDVVSSARRRFHDLFESSATVVLVHDDASETWRVELAEGVRLPETFSDFELPSMLARARFSKEPIAAADLHEGDFSACLPQARSVLTTALRAQDRVVGLVSIEHVEPHRYTEQDAQLLTGVANSLAMAVDNARWFSRLRTLGAEAERARIARDLHDRIAQSLAYVGFELDRIASSRDGDTELRALHQVVREVVAELRETLYQLRVTVDEELDLARVADIYIKRFAERTGILVEMTASTGGRRLALQVEQEFWRILQEALTNVERHAHATRAWVAWQIGADGAALEVRDDGCGLPAGSPNGERWGLVGIRERADAIGARLTLESGPGTGTCVRVELEVES